jgi:hypothetical protein
MNQLSTTTNPTKTTTKSISQQSNRVEFQSFKTKELKRKRKKNPDLARLHHLQAKIDIAPPPQGRDPLLQAKTHVSRPRSAWLHHLQADPLLQAQATESTTTLLTTTTSATTTFPTGKPTLFRASTENLKRRESTERRKKKRRKREKKT